MAQQKDGIRRRGKMSWQVRIPRGLDENGRPRKDEYTVRGTRDDASAFRIEKLHELNQNTYVDPSQLTVKMFLEDHWLKNCEARDLSPSTLRGYRGVVDRYIIPAIGKTKLQRLTTGDVQRMYDKASLSGRVRGEGEGLSGRTVFHIHRILSTALNFAVDLRYVQTNVAGSARPPKPEEKEMHALDVSEVEKALEALKTWPDRRLRAIVLLATFTGLRRGELLALRWKDVDLEGGTVTVARSAQHVKGQGIVFRKPKTSKSRRTIALPQTAVDALTAHAAAQADEMLLVDEGYVDQDLVFANPDGSPHKPDTVSLAFRRFRLAQGLEVRFHDLRHTHATLMLKAKVPLKVVSQRLGHSTAKLTLDTYMHVLEGMDTEAAASFEDLFSESSREDG